MELTLMNLLPNQRLNCVICNYKASCTCKYQSHIGIHADPLDRTLFKCFFCNHRVSTLVGLREHMFTHRDSSEKLKCFVCNVFCKSIKDFKNHLWLHQSLNTQQTLECIYCDHKTYNVNFMKMHVLKHKNFIAVQKCCLCHYKSKSKGDLLRHYMTHKKSPNSEFFTCHFCEYKTKHLSGLRLHLSSHPDKIEVFKCCVCDFECHSKIDFAKHFLIHRDSLKFDSFKCSFCDYVTSYLVDFRLHVLSHNKYSNSTKFCMCQYNCHLCDYKTENESDFQSHLKESHKNISYSTTFLDSELSETTNHSLKEYFPQNRGCSDRSLLKFVRGIETNLIEDPKTALTEKETETKFIESVDGSSITNKKPSSACKYQCDKCSYSTKYRSNYKRHMNTHKNCTESELLVPLTQHKCASCGATYTNKKTLKKHSLVHLDPKQIPVLECEHCEYRTMDDSALNSHIRFVHRKVMPIPINHINNTEFKCVENLQDSKDLQPLKRRQHVEMEDVSIQNQTSNQKEIETSVVESSSINKEELPEEKKYQCEECEFWTRDRPTLKRHKEVHKDLSQRTLFDCTTCGASFTTKSYLKLHSLIHMSPEQRPKLHCTICDYKTFCKFRLGRHMKSRHLKDVKVQLESTRIKNEYECKECSYKTSALYYLRRHEECHKDRSERTLYDCTTCGASFINRYNLRDHSLIHLSPEDRPMLHCTSCDYKTLWKSGLKSHMKSRHMKDEQLQLESTRIRKEYKCKECPYKTPLFSSLHKHKETHKGRSERTIYDCTSCGASFLTKTSFLSHSLKHTNPEEKKCNEMKYQCKECSHKFSNISCLRRHEESHKDRSERTLFNCSACGASFTTTTSLKKHSLKHMNPEETPMLQCISCDFKTLYGNSLRKHMKSQHLKDVKIQLESTRIKKEYKCKECSYKAHSLRYLLRHEESHKDRSKRQLYECAICGFTYMAKFCLKSHIFSQHMGAKNQVKTSHEMKNTAKHSVLSDNIHNRQTFIEPKKEVVEDLENTFIKQEMDTDLGEPDVDLKVFDNKDIEISLGESNIDLKVADIKNIESSKIK